MYQDGVRRRLHVEWPRVIVLAADETRDCSSAPVTLYVVSANLVLSTFTTAVRI